MTNNDLTIKVVQIEEQLARLVSDAESEKDTRRRVNDGISNQLREIDARQTKLERIIYMGLGGLAVLQFLLSFKSG